MRKVINPYESAETGKQGVNSASTPFAQSPELLQAAKRLDAERNKIEYWLERNKYEAKELKALIGLMYSYGLRVSEVLNIKESDILSSGQIKIKGSKGSSNRYVMPVWYSEVWRSRKSRMPVFIRNLSRFYVYRICKRYGFYYTQVGAGNSKVTHYFRYIYMESLRIDNLSKEDRQEAIGHKNVKSQNYYYDKNFKQV